MKILDTILFCFSILMLMIGLHQSMMHGFANSYWMFMLSFGALMWYTSRKKTPSKNNKEKEASSENKLAGSGSKKRKYKM
jgi:hypothetical protein